MFTWNEGEFRWLDDEEPLPDSSLKVKVPQLILTGVTKLAPQEEVDMAVGPLVGKRLVLHPSPPFPLDDLRLTARQSLLAEALRPGRRMGELAEATGLPVDEITRVLYALSILGVVRAGGPRCPRTDGASPASSRTGSWRPPPRPREPAAAPPRAGRPPPVHAGRCPPRRRSEIERRRNEIMQAYLSYRRQDAFDLLGVRGDRHAAGHRGRVPGARPPKFAPWALRHPDLRAMEERRATSSWPARAPSPSCSDVEQRNTLLFRRKTLREEREKKNGLTSRHQDRSARLRGAVQEGHALVEAGKHREASCSSSSPPTAIRRTASTAPSSP